MTTGRYLMRGYVFQSWAFASRALADSGIGPPVVLRHHLCSLRVRFVNTQLLRFRQKQMVP